MAPIPACWLLNTSATSWSLTFWPWNWCPSHVWRGLSLCQFFLGLSVLDLGLMYAIDWQTSDRETSDVRQTDRLQTKASLNASALWGRRHDNSLGTPTSFWSAYLDRVALKTDVSGVQRGHGSRDAREWPQLIGRRELWLPGRPRSTVTMATTTLHADWRTPVEVVVQYHVLGALFVRIRWSPHQNLLIIN